METPSAARAVALLMAYYGQDANWVDEAQQAVLVAEFAQRVPDEDNAKAVVERCSTWYAKFPNVAQLRAAIRDMKPQESAPELPQVVEDPEVVRIAREAALAKVKTFGEGGRQRAGTLGEVQQPSSPHTRSTLLHPQCMLGPSHDGKCLPPPYVDDRRFDR